MGHVNESATPAAALYSDNRQIVDEIFIATRESVAQVSLVAAACGRVPGTKVASDQHGSAVLRYLKREQ